MVEASKKGQQQKLITEAGSESTISRISLILRQGQRKIFKNGKARWKKIEINRTGLLLILIQSLEAEDGQVAKEINNRHLVCIEAINTCHSYTCHSYSTICTCFVL